LNALCGRFFTDNLVGDIMPHLAILCEDER
jgi:hypothetical protein